MTDPAHADGGTRPERGMGSDPPLRFRDVQNLLAAVERQAIEPIDDPRLDPAWRHWFNPNARAWSHRLCMCCMPPVPRDTLTEEQVRWEHPGAR